MAETLLISCPGVLYPKAARALTTERMSSVGPELPGPGAIQASPVMRESDTGLHRGQGKVFRFITPASGPDLLASLKQARMMPGRQGLQEQGALDEQHCVE